MGCGCGGAKKPAGAPPASGSGQGPANQKGSYYWTGPRPANRPKPPQRP